MSEQRSSTGQRLISDPIESMRLRPQMYIGSLCESGLQNVIDNLVGEAVGEFVEGNLQSIDIQIHENGSITVSDDGCGLPDDIKHPRTSEALIDWISTDPSCPWERTEIRSLNSFHAIGYAAANALSEWYAIESRRNGKLIRSEHRRGRKSHGVEESCEPTSSGLSISYLPDSEIFETTDFDVELLEKRCQTIVALYPGLTIQLIVEGRGLKKTFHSQLGIADLVIEDSRSLKALHEQPISIRFNDSDMQVAAAFQGIESRYGILKAYVNDYETVDGGTHATGFCAGLHDAILRYGQAHELFSSVIPRRADSLRHLNAAVSLQLDNPLFEGPTRNRLGNKTILSFVRQHTRDAVFRQFENHPDIAEIIVGQAVISASENIT